MTVLAKQIIIKAIKIRAKMFGDDPAVIVNEYENLSDVERAEVLRAIE